MTGEAGGSSVLERNLASLAQVQGGVVPPPTAAAIQVAPGAKGPGCTLARPGGIESRLA